MDKKNRAPLIVFGICSFPAFFSNWPEASGYSTGETVYWIVTSLLTLAVSLTALVFFTDGYTVNRKDQTLVKSLGVWGYLWRYIVTIMLACIPTVILMLLIPILSSVLFVSFVILPWFLLAAFLFFCRDKKTKLIQIQVFFGSV